MNGGDLCNRKLGYEQDLCVPISALRFLVDKVDSNPYFPLSIVSVLPNKKDSRRKYRQIFTPVDLLTCLHKLNFNFYLDFVRVFSLSVSEGGKELFA